LYLTSANRGEDFAGSRKLLERCLRPQWLPQVRPHSYLGFIERFISLQLIVQSESYPDIRSEPTPIPTFDGQVGNDNSGNDMQGSGAVKKTYTTDGVMCEQLCRSEHRWQRYYCYYYIV
ncbi:unnamed protein product, partial [Brassica oleracea]